MANDHEPTSPDGDGGERTVSLEEVKRRRAASKKSRHAQSPRAANPNYILPKLNVLRPTELQDEPVPERRWLVADWVPEDQVTLLSGDGGAGKSLLAMQLATAVACGRSWLDRPTTRGRAICLFCEDSADELQRRQAAINRHYEVEFKDLKGLVWLPRVSADNILMAFESKDRGEDTTFFDQLTTAAQEHEASLIIIDALHDVFAGNEIIRTHAQQFIALLRSLAVDTGAAVLLTAHPSQAGLATGSGQSGSTAWGAAVRSRLYLKRPQRDPDQEGSDDGRVLAKMKANYSRLDEISLRYEAGVFIALQPKTGVFATIHRHEVEAAFLDGLEALDRQGRNASPSPAANNFVVRLLVKDKRCRKFSRRELEGAMERLFQDGRIRVEDYGRRSAPNQRIARVEAAETEDDGIPF